MKKTIFFHSRFAGAIILLAVLFFSCKKWHGQIKINEPEKCSEQLWLMPEEFINHPDAIPYVAKVIELIEAGQVYSERA